jgi:hypothetical protein
MAASLYFPAAYRPGTPAAPTARWSQTVAMTARPTPPRGLTWQEFLDLPEEMRHAELIDGEIVVTAASASARCG